MSETVQLAIIATIVPSLASVVAAYVAWSGRKKVEETAKKVDSIGEKTTEIHTSTNGTLSAMTMTLEVARAEIAGLRQLVAAQVKSQAEANGIALATAALVEPPKKAGG